MEMNMHILPKIIHSLKEIMFEINYYYQRMNKFNDKLQISQDSDCFKKCID